MSGVLDNYSTENPSPQVALDIFRGEWSSRLPTPWNQLQAGPAPHCEDPRAAWGIAQLGGVRDQEVLELGPLEAGHTCMLEREGARSVLAIEANTRAFLRCLIVKEIVGLRAARFLCGDFREFLKTTERRFDMVFASGVLYHMTDPVQLIADIARTTRRVYLWTHYADPDIAARHETLSKRLGPVQDMRKDDFTYQLHRFSYENSLDWVGFCGGSAAHCAWLTRDSILGALAHFGFGKIDIGFEDRAHPNGPCFSIAAQRA
jgi:SAM-dependent methyltransferase